MDGASGQTVFLSHIILSISDWLLWQSSNAPRRLILIMLLWFAFYSRIRGLDILGAGPAYFYGVCMTYDLTYDLLSLYND